ncbi:hypothetical protein UFOVP602_33 [uncultured Caudovirales phage]|jgi:hypothetical protein|uniref:Terminase small subunit n=1 Tax=uncultured Caudovirales phage TaxID=2100421 RepID=A0A6J5N4K7_9CAUD|nr:hypothetical protein UFOVP602_33 [uncultured Caudovirales phage]
MAHAGGRPSDYDPSYCEKITKFFNVDPYIRENYTDGQGVERTRLIPNRFPTLARFAAELDLDRGTLADWASKVDMDGELVYPGFSRAYKRAKDFQEAFLAEGGIAGAFETPFAIFTAKNVIGWKDRQDIAMDAKHTGGDGGPIKNEVTLKIVRSNGDGQKADG